MAALTFQDAIQRLHSYWSEQGCLVWQPSNTEVGAGTMNSATFLRVLGPEPWRVGYVEPSVRPDDSRYGDNPNRMQMHTQYQLILKPDPGNPQELYLKSLEAIGIDPTVHDIRFVEDNWESPALGAWGLGWEVWMDGMEITQYTYFQQAGGVPLDSVAVEVTYGLERILMSLQGATHFKEIEYAPGIPYGEVLGTNEYEMSVYNLDAADVDRVRQLFEIYEAEARMLLEQGLVLPAHSYVLKTSHAFNILDSRGVVGVTERAHFFARMRNLSREVAEIWTRQREELGHPLGLPSEPSADEIAQPQWSTTGEQTFLLEIGSEELPPHDVRGCVDQLRSRVPQLLGELRLSHGEVTVDATPRRTYVVVNDLAMRQTDEEKEVKGPRVASAYDDDGKPTKALQGFLRSQGVTEESLERTEIRGNEFVLARKVIEGKAAGEVLAEALPELIAGISFTKSMRWNQSGIAYSRPLRWMVALLGDQVVPFRYAEVESGRTSYGLRGQKGEIDFEISAADTYLEAVAAQDLVVDQQTRADAIWQRSGELAGEIGGRIPQSTRQGLLDEVVNLVEHPVPFRGNFEEKYLALPGEVLTTVMKKHQRYFPVEKEDGSLLPAFVGVANGKIDIDQVRAGNEAVIRARYADADFFFQQDVKQSLETFRPKLAGLVFHEKLGSMLVKNERLEQLTPRIAEIFGLGDADRQTLERASFLAKSDLVTNMVVEFTSLAGIMGREYARHSGETADVAEALFEGVLPRSAGDQLPQSPAGKVLAVADRLDSLVGLFSVGLAPKSSADPFALRRAALGIVQILMQDAADVDLVAIVDAAAEIQAEPICGDVRQQVVDFIQRRFEQWLIERGYRHDLIQAVLSARGTRIQRAAATIEELSAVAESDDFARTLTSYARASRIARGQQAADRIDPERLEDGYERTLFDAFRQVEPTIDAKGTVSELIGAFGPLVGPIDDFFDNVFVNVDDVQVKANRYALLQSISRLAEGVIDFSKVEGY